MRYDLATTASDVIDIDQAVTLRLFGGVAGADTPLASHALTPNEVGMNLADHVNQLVLHKMCKDGLEVSPESGQTKNTVSLTLTVDSMIEQLGAPRTVVFVPEGIVVPERSGVRVYNLPRHVMPCSAVVAAAGSHTVALGERAEHEIIGHGVGTLVHVGMVRNGPPALFVNVSAGEGVDAF